MFSLSPGAKKGKKHPKANQPLDRQGVKEAKNFAKGVTRFLRYNKDLLSQKKYGEIASMRGDFLQKIEDGKDVRKEFESSAAQIAKVCEKSKPDYQNSVIKENIEVLFVAVVIAMGVRAYFIQQFKIPTGSMQPTLNGIVAYKSPESKPYTDHQYFTPEGYEKPNPVSSLVQKIWYGRTHVEWRAKEDGDSREYYSHPSDNEGLVSRNPLILFPRAQLKTAMGHRYSASGSIEKVKHLLTNKHKDYKKGDLIARGYLETGDMLIVNKMIYHFTKPKRDDVFVFNTKNIRGIQDTINPAYGSQHYIKRLCGVPGDTITINNPEILVNGEPPKEPGIQRVISEEGYYRGYFGYGAKITLEPKQYLALGDNSMDSLDSRAWGHVPEENIVGKAAFVFYPFGNHFGRIE